MYVSQPRRVDRLSDAIEKLFICNQNVQNTEAKQSRMPAVPVLIGYLYRSF